MTPNQTQLLKKMAAMEKVAVRYLSAFIPFPTPSESKRIFRQHVRDEMKKGGKP